MSYRSALVDRILLMRWDVAALSDVDALLSESKAAYRSLGKPLITIMIVPVDVPAPADDIRKAMGQSAAALLECTEIIHLVMEGTGFKNSIKRSVTTSVLALTGKRGKMVVHKDFDEALAA